MADSDVTIRDVFELPHPGSPEESSPRWQSLSQWINEDLAAAKSPAIDDIGATIEELLNIPVTDIFVKSWKETDAIKDLLAESRKSPVAVTNVELADHTIKSQHRPHIEVRRKKATSKKIEFTVRLVFKLHGFSVRIQNGHIKEIRTGPCEMQGTLQYQGLAVVEQKNGPIILPQVIALDEGQKAEVKEPAPVEIPAAAHPQPSVQPRTIETAARLPAVESNVTDDEATKPKVIEPVAPSPVVEADVIDDETTEPKVIEPALQRTAEPEKVQSSPDLSSLIPPKKIIPQETEPASPPKVSNPPPDVAQTEEEEREVFVL
jgi:hypothetical protein